MFCGLLRLSVRNRIGEDKVDLLIQVQFLFPSLKRIESCKKLSSYPFRFSFQSKTESSWLEKCRQNRTVILQNVNIEKCMNEYIKPVEPFPGVLNDYH